MDVAVAASTPVFLPRSSRWILGVDLGQSVDPTAICALEHIKGVLDFNSQLERHTGTGTIPQKPAERFDVRHLERLPLGMTYPAIVAHVKELLARPPLCGITRQGRLLWLSMKLPSGDLSAISSTLPASSRCASLSRPAMRLRGPVVPIAGTLQKQF